MQKIWCSGWGSYGLSKYENTQITEFRDYIGVRISSVNYEYCQYFGLLPKKVNSGLMINL